MDVQQCARPRRSIDTVLGEARARLQRLTPDDAWLGARSGVALIIDIRTPTDRVRDGVIPGSLHLPRTVLEWRVDPASRRAHPAVGGCDRLVLVCNEGYSSSLAAVALQEIGFENATDIIDGIRGWERAGLPLVATIPLEADLRDGTARRNRGWMRRRVPATVGEGQAGARRRLLSGDGAGCVSYMRAAARRPEAAVSAATA